MLLDSSSFGGLVGIGFMPKRGIKPKVSCAGVHLRASSLVVHLNTAASATIMEQHAAARPRRRSMIGANKRINKGSKQAKVELT